MTWPSSALRTVGGVDAEALIASAHDIGQTITSLGSEGQTERAQHPRIADLAHDVERLKPGVDLGAHAGGQQVYELFSA